MLSSRLQMPSVPRWRGADAKSLAMRLGSDVMLEVSRE